MFTKILVALDIKEDYTHVFNQALDLAVATRADIHLLSVLTESYDYLVPTRYYPGSMGYVTSMDDTFWSNSQTELKEIKERGIRTLTRLCSQANDKGVQAGFSQVDGEPGKVICEHAKSQAADLVIVGSHGRRGLNELLVGSVSSYVMHRAPCSVMIVHTEVSTEESAQDLADLTAA